MARERKPMEDLNAQAKQAVEETKEQALGAADTYFDFLNKTVASFPSGGTDFGEKLTSTVLCCSFRCPGYHLQA